MKKAKNKQLRKYILWAFMALIVGVLAVMPLMATTTEEADGPKASILSGTVSSGNVEAVIRGGGNLEAKEQEAIDLPSGVKITEFLVTNGDLVTEGTPLAAVDRVTLMEAIVQVQDTLKHIQSDMLDAKDDTISTYIRATAGGRIKKIYGQPGETVQEVMLRDGALAVLSLDGLMAVKLERDIDLTTGDTVCVTFDDDTEVEGKVESSLNGTIVVTVEDEGYPMGEKVTVTTQDGTRVGRGELYPHNTWIATGFAGTITTVHQKEEDTVYDGTKLFTLKDTDYTAELERLAREHREYEQLMQEMIIMYENGAILAPCDGIVSGIDIESTHLLAAEEVQWEVNLLGNTQTGEEKGWKIVLLSNGEEGGDQNEKPSFDWSNFCSRDENCTSTFHFPGCPKSDSGSQGGGNAPSEGSGYTGYVALVLSVDAETGSVQVVQSASTTTVTDPANAQVDTSTLETVQTLSSAQYSDGTAVAVGDYLLILEDGSLIKLTVASGSGGAGGDDTEGEGGEGQMPEGEGMEGMGSMSGMGGAGQMPGGAGATATPAFEPYPLEGSALMTITAQSEAVVTITVDEHDIAKLQVGQSAQVKVSALRGQVFEGVVTELSRMGSNNGGSSKFTAEVTLPMAEDMISGMSATVTIPLYTKMDVLTVPVAALVENGTQTQVYTALDPETGKPSSPVTVKTGLSDGETVEILEGLESGQKYYYSYYDTLEVSTEVKSSGGFGF